MLLSTQTSTVFKCFGEREGLRILKGAGFDALDLTLCDISRKSDYIFAKDDAVQYAEQVKKWADEEGIFFNQAHTPFSFHWDAPNELEERFFPLTIHSFKIAAAVGADVVVVHPYTYGYTENTAEELFDFNIKLYKRLIPYAKDLGIRIGLENMYRKEPKRGIYVPSVCGTEDEFIRYMDTLDSEQVVACLDLGHCSLVGIEAQDFIRALGHDRLKALHVHDNAYRADDHTLPGAGKMNWEEITKALAQIDYSGIFTYEADSFLNNFENDFKPCACRFMEQRGRNLIDKIEAYKGNKIV